MTSGNGAGDDASDVLPRLMNAIEMEEIGDVRSLIAAFEIDLDVVDEPSGMTPLQLAVDIAADGAQQHRRPPDDALVRLLLAAGASPGVPGADGETAADIADHYEWTELATMLRQRALPPA